MEVRGKGFIGRRVTVISSFGDRRMPGAKGTVKCFSGDVDSAVYLGVEFDEYIDGHTCDGSVKSGHGRWGAIKEVVFDSGDDQTLRKLLLNFEHARAALEAYAGKEC